MALNQILILMVSLIDICSSKYAQNINTTTVRSIPPGLIFGCSTSAYQVEGAWNEDGKSKSIWDHLTHTRPESIADRTNGDVAGDSYHNIDRDVEMMKELGLDFQRFSISWTRILPTGFPNKINKPGVDYYNRLINTMMEYNIQPMITLYHFDLPQSLQNSGGWTNPNIVNWFEDYARVAFELFGDRVKLWITINEPPMVCNGYESDQHGAPALNLPGVGYYLCAKNILLANAKAWHVYDEEFRRIQRGNISITINMNYHEPASVNDLQAAEDFKAFTWGCFVHPIFSEEGDFPSAMKARIGDKSFAQGFNRSRLPEFTENEIEYIKGTSDFFGLNHYTSSLIYRNSSLEGKYASPSFIDDIWVREFQPNDWLKGTAPWIVVAPWGFHNVLKLIRTDFKNPPVFVTENGIATTKGLDDHLRVQYHRVYINAMLDAIEEGSNIVGYSIWSLMDNFEWNFGYSLRFGLYEVDFSSPLRTRTPRVSAFVYKEMLRTRTLDFSYHPDLHNSAFKTTRAEHVMISSIFLCKAIAYLIMVNFQFH